MDFRVGQRVGFTYWGEKFQGTIGGFVRRMYADNAIVILDQPSTLEHHEGWTAMDVSMDVLSPLSDDK